MKAHLLGVLGGVISFLSPTPADAAVPAPRSIFYLKDDTVYRLDSPYHKPESLFRLPAAEVAVMDGRPLIETAAGRLLWQIADGQGGMTLGFWDGNRRGKVDLPAHDGLWGYSGLPGWQKDPSFWRQSFADDVRLDPRGERALWNVNVTTGVAEKGAGVASVVHRVYSAALGEMANKPRWEEAFDSDDYGADHLAQRRLLRWSRVRPERLFLTWLHEEQLGKRRQGLYTLDLKDGVLQELDPGIQRVLALSEDETLVAHAPNDESCCMVTNQTNNKVWVRRIGSGQDLAIFDEWKEYGNSGHGGDDMTTQAAYFSPDNARIAVALHCSIKEQKTPGVVAYAFRERAIVRGVEPGIASLTFEDRRILGWVDARRLLIGSLKTAAGIGRDRAPTIERLILVDATTGAEEGLPVSDILVLGVSSP